jgi:ABC-type branched-subunit amino acid transport system ATPase component
MGLTRKARLRLGEVTLRWLNLTKSFDGVRIIDDLTLELEAGKVTALVGPNGAGKSSLFNLATGFLAPDKGEIWYKQQRIDRLRPHVIARLGIGRLFQDVRVFERLTSLENVLVGFPNQSGENPIWPFLHPRIVRREELRHVDEAKRRLELVGLGDRRHHAAETLSCGHRKLLAIARLLTLGSEVLLLDEPTTGVSPEMISTLVDLLKKLAREGRTVAVVEHNMSVVAESSDWVHFMDAGRLIASGTPDDVLGRRDIRAMYLGL